MFDVGGDDDGAYALGQYKSLFDSHPYSMYFVANTRRPLTSDTEGLCEVFDSIERASRLKFTGIINNTNLSYMTDENILFSGYDEIQKLSEIKNVPVVFNSGTEKAAHSAKDGFIIRTYLKKPWEI